VQRTKVRSVRRVGVLLGVLAVLVIPDASAQVSPLAVSSKAEAVRAFLDDSRVSAWLERYNASDVVTTAERSKSGNWTVQSTVAGAGAVATGEVSPTGQLAFAWVGPQVAWPLARGQGLGGAINRPLVWLSFCLFFLLGLGNLRRPLSMQNLDLLALLSLSVYLVFFNEGRVFASAIAAAASLTYLAARCVWLGVANRATPTVSVVPIWLLVAGLVFLGGLRVGLNTFSPHTLDVTYAGVVGADRLSHAQTPYGTFPQNTLLPCGPENADEQVSDWIQDNGRCETALPLGDTYGPVTYHAYLPGLWIFGWSGKWDTLPAAKFTTILFDLLALLGMAAIGYRYGGQRLGATLAFAWAAYPFTQYVVSSNSNDSIQAALLIWGFWCASSPVGRGAFSALASWAKLAALIVVPLWLTYPRRAVRPAVVFALTFVAVSIASFWVVLLGDDPLHGLRVFYERTFEIQAERSSPFSLWDWGDYHARGLPDLSWLQKILQAGLVVAAILVSVRPKEKTPLQLAAFTAALLLVFELSLTHWNGLYAVWFFPFVLLATYAGSALRGEAPEVEEVPTAEEHVLLAPTAGR
jgi:hypothetical protein